MSDVFNILLLLVGLFLADFMGCTKLTPPLRAFF